MSQQPQHFEKPITKTASLNYLLYLPPGYSEDVTVRWPLILFLHGSGERGDDLELVKLYGLPKKLAAGDDLPFIIASPQCPADSYWTLYLDDLKGLVDDLSQRYAVNRQRLYLTGMSMGGTGVWLLAAAFPDLFAAMIPICGRGTPTLAARLKHIPIWAFHGEADSVVPADESRRMTAALKAQGSSVKLTLYPNVDHDSWTQTYANPDVYDWLLQHTR
jgi:predicted peptidase